MRPTSLSILALMLIFTASAGAQNLDLSGEWELTTQAFFGVDAEGADCLFDGTADIAQDGDALSGMVSYTLSSGDDACPESMTASLTGTVVQTQVEMGALMGPLGMATFDGNVILPEGGDGPLELVGDFQITGGVFSGTGGSWTAVLSTPDVLAIPTLGIVGGLALALLLIGAGFLVLRRRPWSEAG